MDKDHGILVNNATAKVHRAMTMNVALAERVDQKVAGRMVKVALMVQVVVA